MLVRRLVLLGFCAAFGMATTAAAEERRYLFPTKAERAAALEAKGETARERKGKASAKVKKPAKPTAAKGKTKLAAKKPKAKLAEAQPTRRKSVRKVAAPALTSAGNIGELRSETAPVRKAGFLSALFGEPDEPRMLPQTRALDASLAQRNSKKKFSVKSAFEPQLVAYSGYPKGAIVVDTDTRFLYLIESSSEARRYAIAVGREGLLFTGTATIGDKQEWPRWIPTLDMQKREPKKYGPYKDGMPGGPDNPLGARAIYLYQGNKDTHIRIHGTNQPETIGSASSNGCFRMVNDHVMDLYRRVSVGAKVIVL